MDQENDKLIKEEIINQKSTNLQPITVVLGVVAIISLVLNIILVSKLPSQDATTKNAVAEVPTQPTPAKPTPKPDIVQTFTVTKDDHVRGDFNAPITLVEFSDFECPYCEKHAPTLDKILADYKGKVRLVFKSFPLSFHENGQKASESAECASEQGKFWEMHDILFKNQPSGFSTDKFKKWARDIGLNGGQFDNCLDTDKYADKVNADVAEGSQKGVEGTPATFVNGTLVSGAVPYAQFKAMIDGILAKK